MKKKKPKKTMSKLRRKFLIISIVVLTALFFPVLSLTAENGLQVTPQENLFEVDNFFPGQKVSGEISLSNNLEDEADIKLKIENLVESKDGFAKFLELSVIKDGQSLCSETFDTLEDEWCSMGKLSEGESKDFKLEVVFLHGSGNLYKEADMSLDLLFASFVDVEDPDESPDPPGAAAVIQTPGFEIAGVQDIVLNIFNHKEEVTDRGAKITWETNIPVTGKVIYGTRPHAFNFLKGSPLYGYENYLESEESTFHEINLENLRTATYYYRIVAYHEGVPTITRSMSFSFPKEDPVEEESQPETDDLVDLEPIPLPEIMEPEEDPVDEEDPEEEPVSQPEDEPEKDPPMEQEEEITGFLAATLEGLNLEEALFYGFIIIIILVLILIIRHLLHKINKKLS